MTWAVFGTILIVHLLGCMSPGPDFIVVVRNTLGYNRRIALYTAAGIAAGMLLHTSYCALGLGVVLLASPKLFHLLRILGAGYLGYLSVKIFCAKQLIPTIRLAHHKKSISHWRAFRQGFFTNALNPKAVLFILGLFIMVTKCDSPWWSLFFVVEMSLVTWAWFSFIAYCFSHAYLKAKLMAVQNIVAKGLAVFLFVFALQLVLGQN